MQEIRIANYTLIIAMLLVMTTFCVSFQSFARTCDLMQNQQSLASIR